MKSNSDAMIYLPDPILRRRRYTWIMQLLSLAMAVVCISALILSVLNHAQTGLLAYLFVAMIVYFMLFAAFRTGHLQAGFFGLIYFSSLLTLAGNTLIGWRSGIFVLLFLLIPAIFYNPLLQRTGKIMLSAFFGAAALATIVLGFFFTPVYYYDAFKLQVMNETNIFITCLVLVGISYIDYRNSNAIARHLIDLNNRLAYQASRDPLTDLLNRRTMTQFIENECARSSRSGKPFGLIMTDVDDFKQVNDQHGHAAGDLVLVELSGLLTEALRKQDLISRWGGEEFLMLLPETDYEGVQIAAEKIRNLVSQNRILYNGKLIQVTFSIGGVVCQNRENWDECIILADRALYYGKNHGKNLAVFAKGDLYCVLGNAQESILQ